MEMHQLYKLGRTLIDAAQRAQGVGEHRMTPSEHLVLRDLFFNGQSSIGQIATRTDIAQSRVSICIRRLVERGWVLTAADPSDGRKTLARVTERVKDEGARRRAMNAEDALAPLLDGCTAAERQAITHALDRLYYLAVDGGNESLKPVHLGASPHSPARSGAADGGPARRPLGPPE